MVLLVLGIIEHSRHRNPVNFMVNLIAGLIRYTYFEKKPSINFSVEDRKTLLNTLACGRKNADSMGIIAL